MVLYPVNTKGPAQPAREVPPNLAKTVSVKKPS